MLKTEGFGILTVIDMKGTLKRNWMLTFITIRSRGPVILPLRTKHC